MWSGLHRAPGDDDGPFSVPRSYPTELPGLFGRLAQVPCQAGAKQWYGRRKGTDDERRFARPGGAVSPTRQGPAHRARLAVAGLGRMGMVHATNVARRCPSAELVAVFDLRPDVAREAGERLGARVAPTYDDLLDSPEVDAVVVATPTGAHAEMAVRAAAAGKHVFCEKPLSLERVTTAQMVADIEAAGTNLQVGFHRRFDPPTAAVAARMRQGELGAPYLFRASQRDMSPPRPEFLAGSGGIFVDMGIHDLDLARWLLGEVVSVSARGTALSSPGFQEIGDYDTAVVTLGFANGALGIVDLSRVAGYGYDSSVEVVGRAGTARIDEPFAYGYELRTPGTAARPLVSSFDQRYSAAFVAEMEDFARSVTEVRPPLVGGRDALAAFDLAAAAAEAARSGTTVQPASSGTGTDDQPAGPAQAAGEHSGARTAAPNVKEVGTR